MQLKGIRFENPQFSLRTTFNRDDFTRLLIDKFDVPEETVVWFFDMARSMNFYDDQSKTDANCSRNSFRGGTTSCDC